MRTPRLDRRQALRLFGCCGVGLAGAYAIGVEPAWLEVTEHEVAVRGLPRGMHGYRIAQLSDLHLSSLDRLHDRVLAAVRAAAPDLVAITGDAVEDEAALGALTEFCHELAVGGRTILATVGNWEHWGHVRHAALHAAYERAGVRLLGDEAIRLDAGLAVIATDDFCSGFADAATAFHRVPSAAARLFLTHAPGILDALPEGSPGFDLALAGHTHGGQVRAFGATVWVPPGSGRFRAGMYATAKGQAYVSRGLGTSVLQARFTCRPELPVIRLVAGG
ncbi:putative phosphoesterase [Minicystis rosea]|nr:putative phosphoesterase [Minicystis rosea]